VVAARGVVVAGIEMPLRSDGDCSGVCVGGDQQRWKKGGRVMERHGAGDALIRRRSNGSSRLHCGDEENEETWTIL